MIKANELRVGNWVNCVKQQGYNPSGSMQIISIGGKGVNSWQDMGASGWVEFENIEPIALTPEILEQCGFENRSNTSDYCFENGEIILGGITRRLFLSSWGESGLEGIGKEIKYLHQIQNLYFALTGEELKVNL